MNNRGFTMVETLFSFSLCSIILCSILPALIYLHKKEYEVRKNVFEKINTQEAIVQDQFYPVEDVEWVLKAILE